MAPTTKQVQPLDVDGRQVRVTSPDRVCHGAIGLAKLALLGCDVTRGSRW